MITALRGFNRLAASVILTLGLAGCGGDKGTGSNPDNPGSGGGDPSYTYTGETIKIGNQTWMAENLDVETPNSKCYGNSADSCAQYGRLYTWSDAMTACPSGWHLPSDAEWTTLTDFVGGESTAGTKLKSTSGWNNNGNGTDAYGFSALSGGYGSSDGNFGDVGYYGYWWSATEVNADGAYRYMGSTYEYVYRGNYSKTYLLSVRCVRVGSDAPNPTAYIITFDANGGSGTAPAAQTVKAGSSITLPAQGDLTRSGYAFGGWNTNRPGTGTNYNKGSSYTPAKNTTLFAKWDASYTVTFNADSGNVNPTSGTTTASGTLPSLPTPTRSGYTFDGWYTASTGGTEVTTSSIFGKDSEIYARWVTGTVATYTITFNAGSGSVTPASGTTTASGTLPSLPTPTRSGYTFDGWYTSSSGGTEVTTSSTFSADAAIYAQWTLRHLHDNVQREQRNGKPDVRHNGRWLETRLPAHANKKRLYI